MSIRLDAEIASLAAVAAEADALLARVPEPPDPDAIDAVWRQLHDLRVMVAQILPADRRPVLHALGTIVVNSDGVRLCPRPELAGFLACADHTAS